MQEHFYTAISWLVATGIHTKMINDAQAELRLASYWTMPSNYEIEPLLLSHIMLSFLLFFGGLSLATIMFVIEMAPCKIKMQMSDSVGREGRGDSNRKIEDVIIHLVEL